MILYDWNAVSVSGKVKVNALRTGRPVAGAGDTTPRQTGTIQRGVAHRVAMDARRPTAVGDIERQA
jgi:hypothetical protein